MHHRRSVQFYTGWPAFVLALCGAWCLVLTAIDEQQWPREIPPLEVTRSSDAPQHPVPGTAPGAWDARTDPAGPDSPATTPVLVPPAVPPDRPGVQTDGLMSQVLVPHDNGPSPTARAVRQAGTPHAGSSEQRSGTAPARDADDGTGGLPVERSRDLPHQGDARPDPWWWSDDDRFVVPTDQLEALLLEALPVRLDRDPSGWDPDLCDVDDWYHPDNDTIVTIDVPIPDQPPANGVTEWADIPEFPGEDPASEARGSWAMSWTTDLDGTDYSNAQPAQIATDPLLTGR